MLAQPCRIAPCFDATLSADTIGTFKPDPGVYELARRAAGNEEVCLIFGNPFDVIGANAAGLKAAWGAPGQRGALRPLEYGPDITVSDLEELCATLPRH